MSTVSGPDELVSAAGASVAVATLAFRFVSLAFVDPAIPACAEAVRGLLSAFAPADGFAVYVVAVTLRDADIEAFFEQFQDHPAASRLFALPVEYLRANLTRLKAAVGLGAALLLPEVVFIDALTGAPISTDAAAVLKRRGGEGLCGELRSRSWRSNCFVAQLAGSDGDGGAAPAASPAASSYSARLHAAALSSAGLFPGDAVIVRPLGSVRFAFASAAAAVVEAVKPVPGAPPSVAPSAGGMSLCLYVNPPPHSSDGDDEDDGEGAGLAADVEELAPHAIVLSASILGNLGIPVGATVSVELLADPPAAAEAVTFRAEGASGGDAAPLHALLGTDRVAALAQARTLLAATAALRAGRTEDELLDELEGWADEGAGAASSALQTPAAAELRRAAADALRAQCRYVPVVAGQLLHAPAAPVASGSGAGNNVGATSPETGVAATQGTQAFRVVSTRPRFSAVVVGPETRVEVLQ